MRWLSIHHAIVQCWRSVHAILTQCLRQDYFCLWIAKLCSRYTRDGALGFLLVFQLAIDLRASFPLHPRWIWWIPSNTEKALKATLAPWIKGCVTLWWLKKFQHHYDHIDDSEIHCLQGFVTSFRWTFPSFLHWAGMLCNYSLEKHRYWR